MSSPIEKNRYICNIKGKRFQGAFRDGLKGQCHKILTSGFLHGSVTPKPLIIAFRRFKNFSKIRGDMRSSRCTTGVNDTGGK
jgi:hypothetical protein